MKRFISILLFVIPLHVVAQVMPDCHKVGAYLEFFDQDSIKAYYNEIGVLTDSSSAEFYRVGRIDPLFCDVWGDFTDYHMNGKPMFRGSMSEAGLTGKGTYYLDDGTIDVEGEYENNHRTGIWTFYHPNGTISLVLDLSTDIIRILETKNPRGKSKIVNGNGKFKGIIYTGRNYMPYDVTGKVKDGRMDGIWQMSMHHSDGIICEETYLNGEFIQGQTIGSNYKKTGHPYKDQPKISFCESWPNERAFFYRTTINALSEKFFDSEYAGSNSLDNYYTKVLSAVQSMLDSNVINQWILVSYNITEMGQMTDTWTFSSINDTIMERKIADVVDRFPNWKPRGSSGLSKNTLIFFIILVIEGKSFIVEREALHHDHQFIKPIFHD